MNEKKNRRLAAIMFTDIVGYTALMQQDEKVAVEVRTHHRQVFQDLHAQHDGTILQYYGDGTLSVFQSAVEAVECAMGIQQELQQGLVVPLRIGIDLGDIVFDGTEVYGDGVNQASRIESMGVPGAILVSDTLNEELHNQVHINTVSMGDFNLKNVSHPVEVFAVSREGIRLPDRSELKGKQQARTQSIAVLPFVNMSPNHEQNYFSDGLTEEVINALSKVKPLKVTSRTSSFYYKNKNLPITQIGKQLHVSTILEGSIRVSGNQVRITAQLINAEEDTHYWSHTFDRSLADVFAVQEEISLLIVERLRESLGYKEEETGTIRTLEVRRKPRRVAGGLFGCGLW